MSLKKTISAMAALAVSISAFAGFAVTANAASTLPITEDFEDESTIFTGGNIYDNSKYNLTKIYNVYNGKATGIFDGDDAEGVQSIDLTNKAVTIEYDAYHGWLTSGKSTTVALLNSDGVELVSYGYNWGNCNIDSVKIGGTTAANFNSFSYQSSYNGTNSANGYEGGSNGRHYVNKEGYNPHITIEITGNGIVTVSFVLSGKNIDKSYSGVLSDNITKDIASITIDNSGNSNADRGYGIDNISVKEDVLDPSLVPHSYTINYQLSGETVSQETGSAIADTVITAKTVIDTEDARYFIIADEAPSMIIDADGENVLNVPVRLAGNYNYTIMATGDVEKELSSKVFTEGDSGNMYYPRYIQEGTTIYEATRQSDAPYYGKYVTNEGSLEVTYTKKYDDVVYFADFDDDTGTGVGQQNHASNGAVKNNAAWSTTLDAGKYQIIAYVCNRSRGSAIAVGGTQIATVADNATSQGYGLIDKEFTVTENGTTVELTKGESSYDPIDTVIIRKVGGISTPELPKGDVKTVKTSTDLEGNAAASYMATFESDSAFDVNGITWTVTNVDGVTAPIVESVDLKNPTTIQTDGAIVFGLVIDAGNSSLDTIDTVTAELK